MKHRIQREVKAVCLGLTVVVYIFGCSFLADSQAASAGLSSAIAFQRPDAATVTNATGTVTASQSVKKGQEFTVTVKNIPLDAPVDGLAVYLGAAPGDTNRFNLVNVLNGGGTNGMWRLTLRDKLTAPVQLGVSVTNVTDLAGRVVRISDNATNVYLQTIIPSFVPSLSALNFNRHAKLLPPDPAPSPKATGTIHVRLNAVKGTSSYEVQVRNLSGGNSYCCWFLQNAGDPTSGDCPKTPNLINGSARFGADTGKGQQLFKDGLIDGFISVEQISGLVVEIRDQFGATHLRAVVP